MDEVIRGDSPSSELNSLQDAIIDLYMSVKVRTKDQLANLETSQVQEEREALQEIKNPFIVLEYIRASLDIVMNMKQEEAIKAIKDQRKSEKNDPLLEGITQDTPPSTTRSDCTGPPKAYEKIIQTLEADVRKHIRIE